MVGDIKLHTKYIFCFVWPVYHQNHAHHSKIQKDFKHEKCTFYVFLWKMKNKFGEQGRTEQAEKSCDKIRVILQSLQYFSCYREKQDRLQDHPAFFTGFTCFFPVWPCSALFGPAKKVMKFQMSQLKPC